MRTFLKILKWILIAGIILFSIATLMGGSYLQTLILWLIAFSLAWWPDRKFGPGWSKKRIFWSRVFFIVIMLILNKAISLSNPKESIYKSDKLKSELMSIYDEKERAWPEDHENIYIGTGYGDVHILACGSEENPPLMMLHAASMGAHSWAENLEPLLDHYRIYSIDNIGEGNKSNLNDALIFPSDGRALADLYAEIADSLGIKSSPVFGASNGGFIAQNYAFYHPDRVKSLALFGPMGLTQLSTGSIMTMALSSMYPFKFMRNRTLTWALGSNPVVTDKYGDWFDCIIRSTIPSIAQPVPATTEQKNQVDVPVILFLGTKDPIVGDSEFAAKTARDFRDIQIEILESGHLIATEQAEYVNNCLKEFLGISDSF